MSGENFMEKLLDGIALEWRVLGAEIKTVTAPSKLKREALSGTPPEEGNIFAPQFPSSGGVPEGRGGESRQDGIDAKNTSL
ncbi:MAG: hypothetical protein HQL49_03750 [Gammaproteobacteria bacterium]|nr:hypothetical protein [Gammaproteobacteria bacterium]